MPTQAEVAAGNLLIDYIKREINSDHTDRFKSEPSFGQKFINHLLGPFNPRYMQFNTTLYPTIWWSINNKQRVIDREWAQTETRAHEAVHMYDRKRLWLIFNLLYVGLAIFLFPIPLVLYPIFAGLWGLAAIGALVGGLLIGYILPRKPWWFYPWAILGIAGCLALAIWKTQWHALWIAGAVFLLSPFPLNWLGAAYGRAWAEFRGYSMSTACEYWRSGRFDHRNIEYRMGHFWGGNYVFMCPWKGHVRKKFDRIKQSIESGDILKDPVFKAVYEIMLHSKLVHPVVTEAYAV